MAMFVEIFSDDETTTIINVDALESVQKIIEEDGSISYVVETATRRFPMDAKGYKRLFNNTFIVAMIEECDA